MKQRYAWAVIVIFGLSLAAASVASAITAREIIERSDAAVRGDSQSGIFSVTVKTRRWTRTMKLKSQEIRRQRKSFTEIYEPPKDAGNRFLLLGQNMWHYVPKLQQTVKISPSMMLQSWMGSDFTNDDIVKESSIVEDYTQRLLGNETVDGHGCYKLELLPKPDAAVVWGKIVYFAREGDFLPVREEFYNEHGVLKKTLTCGRFRQMHERVIPTLYRMETAGKEGQHTLMEIIEVRFNVPVPDRVFTLQHLQRR